ncbi:manganese ABC transporter [Cohnella sp. CIP 111063]|jgi:ABC-type Mn2+/Zn2+ transport systems, permease components|uniref:metal ABC transporter permease n=1 Tax=unclassified Cohnella TaxID=2636738 RepID=UPI000B8C6565|nr:MULTISPECIES: metal ABC transporter permease [unclassified Cohnella]OXS53306.1 manganese ABC transporter [Cohnella sp. CIP 111063]PRX61042.1 manganese/zinc/iron transport system permease protein [Cohnella sp. SGD-V74]
MLNLITDPNLQWILLGSMLLGISTGVVGTFAYLRKQSLIGDTLAHAALPGICIAFMLTEVKSVGLFMIGAIVAGMIATVGISWITRYSRIKQDAAMGIVLSVFFGLGIVLLTQIQHSSYGNQSGLDKFLFGQAASMTAKDVYTMTSVAVVLIVVCALLFKEFKLISFDPGYARGLGFSVATLEQLLLWLVTIAVVVGIQAVGVVLVAALLITPAVSARYWTDRLGVMTVLSGLFGALSGAIGTWVSAGTAQLPTGPLSVLTATAVFVASVLFGPQRGVIAKLVRRRTAKRDWAAENAKQSGAGVGASAKERGVSA